MTDRELKPFAAMLGVLCEVYGKPKPTREALQVYLNALAAYPLQEVQAALDAHTRTSKFMPRPADIIEQIEGSADDRARAAWQEVLQAARRWGAYESVRFSSPAIHYALEAIGGWECVCGTPVDKLPFAEKDFSRHHAAAIRSGIEWDRVQHHFRGAFERNAFLDGSALPEVHCIGAEAHPVEALPEHGKVVHIVAELAKQMREG